MEKTKRDFMRYGMFVSLKWISVIAITLVTAAYFRGGETDIGNKSLMLAGVTWVLFSLTHAVTEWRNGVKCFGLIYFAGHLPAAIFLLNLKTTPVVMMMPFAFAIDVIALTIMGKKQSK